jgi:uncharacterized protein YjbI with pentapeptide repeats
MNKKILFIILLFSSLISFSQNVVDLKLDSLNQEELNKYKTEVEIKKTEKELNKFDYSSWLQAGTIIIAIIALIISIITSNKSNKRQIEARLSDNVHKEKDHISGLLKEIGSDSLSVKIAAIQALSEYKPAFPFVINLLRIDNYKMLVDAVIKMLCTDPELSLNYLLEETRTIQNGLLNIAAGLVYLGQDRKVSAQKLGLENGELQNWIENKYGNRIEQLTGIRIRNRISQSGTTENIIKKEEEIKLYNDWEILTIGKLNTIAAIEEIVKEAVRLGLKLKLENAYLDGIMLVKTNLDGFSFTDSSLSFANFEGANCDNTDFSNVHAKNCNMKNCSVNNSKFNNSEFKQCDFRNMKGKNTSFINSKIFEPNFSGSNLKYANFQNAHLVKMSFQDTLFVKGNFNDALIRECSISATDLRESQFIGCKIHVSDFNTTRVRKSNFQNCEIKSCHIIKSSFDDSNMSFSSFINVISIDSQFTGVDLTKANLTNVSFDVNTKVDNLITESMVCKKCSTNLSKFTTS